MKNDKQAVQFSALEDQYRRQRLLTAIAALAEAAQQSSIDHSSITRVGMATADKAKCFMVRMREN